MDVETIQKKRAAAYSPGSGLLSIKTLLLTFLLYMVINNTVYINQVMGNFTDYTSAGKLTEKGIIANGVVLVLGIICLNYLVEHELL